MNLDKILRMNNRDVLLDQMFKGAIISSCDFVYISKNDDGSARFQVIDGSNATGILDTSTMMLTEGYAVLERDTELGESLVEAYSFPQKYVVGLDDEVEQFDKLIDHNNICILYFKDIK